MSNRPPNTIMTDEKNDISPPAEEESITKTDVVIENPSENPYSRAFDANDAEWHKAFEKKLMRKVNLRLIPLMIIVYLNNFIDRASLGQARLGSLEADLGMTGTQFNLSISILFVGYLLKVKLPSNLLITRMRPSLYLGITMLVWGGVCAATAAVQNFAQLLVVRIFLGITEAPFFPGAIFLMSSWYTRQELTKRIAWFYGGVALANMFGGLIAAGLFIVNGSISMAFAISCIFITPNFPQTTKWLTDEQKAYALWRLKNDATEDDDSKSTSIWQGLKLAVTDYRIYIFILLQHISPSYRRRYGRIETLLLTVPVWFATWCAALVVTWSADRTSDRSIHIICPLTVSAVGNAIVGGTTSVGPRFIGMFLMPMGAVSAFQIIVAWVANSFIRPMVKRSAAIAICNASGNCASIYGTYFYPFSHDPHYTPGSAANAAVCVVMALIALVLRFVHIRENKKIAAAEQAGAAGVVGDRRGVGFRYVY
ncbi:hypothetical protein Q7P35_010911 [Cladosporium inversicolor]